MHPAVTLSLQVLLAAALVLPLWRVARRGARLRWRHRVLLGLALVFVLVVADVSDPGVWGQARVDGLMFGAGCLPHLAGF